MLPADREEFLRALNGLAAIKPNAKLTTEALDMWWLALKDWTIGEFKAAAAHLANSVEFMPNPYHFQQLRKTAAEQSCAEAWTKVRAVVRAMNPDEPTSISPRIDRVIRAMGGYRGLAMTDTDEMYWREKRFAELWEELGDVEEARTALPSVAAKLTGPQPSASLLPHLARPQ